MSDQVEQGTTADGEADQESKRGRVRRLLIAPLEADGFRKRRDVSAEAHAAFLDRVADSLGYMSDRGLQVLRASLATKGEGSAKHHWPSFATIDGLAEAFEPRPLRERPELLRWFASRAGQAAMAGGEGRLVAEHAFWRRTKRPPIMDADKRSIAERAAELDRRAQMIRERAEAGLAPTWPDDPDWLRRFEERVAYLRGLVMSENKGDAA